MMTALEAVDKLFWMMALWAVEVQVNSDDIPSIDSTNLLMIQPSWVTYMSVGEWQSYAYWLLLEK